MRASFFVTCSAAVLMTSIDAVKFNKVDAYEPLSNLAEIDSSIATLVDGPRKRKSKPAPAQTMKLSDGGFAAEMGIELNKTAKPAGPKAAKKVDKNARKTKAEVTMESYPLRTRRELRKYLANKTSILCFGYIDHIDELMQLFMTA